MSIQITIRDVSEKVRDELAAAPNLANQHGAEHRLSSRPDRCRDLAVVLNSRIHGAIATLADQEGYASDDAVPLSGADS
jgi:hypothetical protein